MLNLFSYVLAFLPNYACFLAMYWVLVKQPPKIKHLWVGITGSVLAIAVHELGHVFFSALMGIKVLGISVIWYGLTPMYITLTSPHVSDQQPVVQIITAAGGALFSGMLTVFFWHLLGYVKARELKMHILGLYVVTAVQASTSLIPFGGDGTVISIGLRSLYNIPEVVVLIASIVVFLLVLNAVVTRAVNLVIQLKKSP